MASQAEYIRQLEAGHKQRDIRFAEIMVRLAAAEAERDAYKARWESVPLRAIYDLCQWMYDNRHYGNPLYQHVWGWIVKYYKETTHE